MPKNCKDAVYDCLYRWGMEAVLTYLIQRLHDENCDDPYILKLISDLETTLANYKDRNKDQDDL